MNWKTKKTTWVFFYIKYNKFVSISLEHFVERKPLIFEECPCKTKGFLLPNFCPFLVIFQSDAHTFRRCRSLKNHQKNGQKFRKIWSKPIFSVRVLLYVPDSRDARQVFSQQTPMLLQFYRVLQYILLFSWSNIEFYC